MSGHRVEGSSRRLWRFLNEPPRDGSANMARDEALLQSAAHGGPTVLRLYAWARPTLSLGAHQSSGDVNLAACRGAGVDLVRRPTGGGAVLHDRELTYAVAGRLGEEPLPASVVGLYERIADCLISGLARLGVSAESCRGRARGRAPADCFGAASAREIVSEGRKLVGSAQLRRGNLFLQHGSILIDRDPDLMRRVLAVPSAAGALAGASGAGRDVAPLAAAGSRPADGAPRAEPPLRAFASLPPAGSAVTLRELLGRAIDAGEVANAMAEGFRAVLEIDLVPSRLDLREAAAAARLRAFKYLDALWTLEGRVRPGSSGSSAGPARGGGALPPAGSLG